MIAAIIYLRTSLRGTKTTDRREFINTNKDKHNINNPYAGSSIMQVRCLVIRSVQHKDCFVPRNDVMVILFQKQNLT
ncbi:MAG: hypothetical protein JWR38_4904 [Mucilaginibacter sp.]|nr:hypothetical protein [Mucilaginibacter sp.]